MRHRQTTGAGPSGARPSIVVFALTAAGGGLAAGLSQPSGPWAGYGIASLAAIVGFSTLWQQRGLLERRAQESAKRRRADLEAAAVADVRHRTEIERARADLEHEQQYSALIQGQLNRAREQLERERAARRAAERELDALTGTGTWQSGVPSVLLTVEEPLASRIPAARSESAGAVEAAVVETAVEAEPAEREVVSVVEVVEHRTTEHGTTERRRVEVQRQRVEVELEDGDGEGASAESDVAPRQSAPHSAAAAAAQRRGWQVVDGDDEDEGDLLAAAADRLYRPFMDQVDPPAAPVSDAALAMAPVIAAELDSMLDLTAYDETVEFSVREIKGMA